MKNKEETLWNPDFILLCLAAVVARLAFTCQYTAIPLFVQSLNFGKASAGLATSIYSLTALAFRPFMGGLVDKRGRRFTMMSGISIFTLVMGIYVLLGNRLSLGMICWFQGCNGIAFSALTVGMTTICTDVVPVAQLTQGIGIFGLSSTIANAIAPMLALGFIEGNGGYGAYFISETVIAVIAIGLVGFIRYEKRRQFSTCEGKSVLHADNPDLKENKNDARKDTLPWWEKIVERTAVFGSLMVILVAFTASSLNTFLPTLAEEYQILNISLFFTLQAAGTAVSRIGAAGLVKRLGNMPALILSYVCLAIGYLGIFSLVSDVLIVVMGVFCGIGQGLGQTILNTSAVIRAPKERRGAANATFYMAMDIGIGIGGTFWGVFADAAGTRLVYLGAAIIVGMMTLFCMMRQKKLRETVF